MNKSLIQKIEGIIQETRNLVEKDTPLEIPNDIHTYTTKELEEFYAKVLNYNNIIKAKMKDLRYIVYILTDAKFSIPSDTPSNAAIYRQLNAYITKSKYLLEVLDTIDSSHIQTIRFLYNFNSL